MRFTTFFSLLTATLLATTGVLAQYDDDYSGAVAARDLFDDDAYLERSFDDVEEYDAREYFDAEEYDARDFDIDELKARYYDEDFEARDYDDEEEMFARERGAGKVKGLGGISGGGKLGKLHSHGRSKGLLGLPPRIPGAGPRAGRGSGRIGGNVPGFGNKRIGAGRGRILSQGGPPPASENEALS